MSIIPIFLPYAGCKHRCVFCDQVGATGESRRPSPDEIESKIKEYLKTKSHYELAFYGGTFTALPRDVQKVYLEVVSKWFGKGISSLRVSTRPDEIDKDEADFLKGKGVKVVEIGAQSMFDEVLLASKRGHSAEDVIKAVEILKSRGFTVGVHLMVGLPSSSAEKDIESSKIVANLGVDLVRIHPTLVFKGTELHNMLKSGVYKPLELEEAVEITAEMAIVLEASGAKLIRIGLHVPVEQRKNIVGGPYHPSFGDFTRARMIRKMAEKLHIRKITVDAKHESWVFGYGNRKTFEKLGTKIDRGTEFLLDHIRYENALKEYVRESRGECDGEAGITGHRRRSPLEADSQ